jgi:hypothetical protein
MAQAARLGRDVRIAGDRLPNHAISHGANGS